MSMEDSTASFGVLVLEGVQPDDGAVYRCTATNSVGQSAPYDVRVDVVEPLRVHLTPGAPVLRVDQGRPAAVRCSFNRQYGTPAGASGPVVRWTKDGAPIAKYQQSAALSAPDQQPTWTLNVNHMQRSDEGVYQCFVFTERESAQATVRLVLGGKSFVGNERENVEIGVFAWCRRGAAARARVQRADGRPGGARRAALLGRGQPGAGHRVAPRQAAARRQSEVSRVFRQ